ncbi:MAG TPA: MATE family efflux transporter [Tepiditoga sp.]|nr:MATE family efflux transporter [Tepiditoga sp.]
MKRDLTEGNIIKQIFLMSIPTMIGFSAQMIYDLVDLFWIGRISSDAIAGVTIFSTIFWVVESLNEIIGTSSISLISQAYGKKDSERTNLSIEQTISFKFLVAVVASAFLILFLKPIMGFLGSTEVVSYGLSYGYIRIFFLPIMFSSYSVNTALRCIGDARTPMVIMILSSILNIILDPILMFEKINFFGITVPGFGKGIFGAALATIIAQTVSFIIGFYILFSGKRGVNPSIKNLFRLNREIDKKLLTIGLPNGFEIFIRNIQNVFVLKVVGIFGTAAISATGISSRLFGFAFTPLVGLSMGGSTIIGQSLGAEKTQRAKKTSVYSAVISLIIMTVFYLFVIFMGKDMIKIFTNDIQTIKYGYDFMIIATAGLMFISISFGLSTAFSGSGYNIPFFVSSLVSKWFAQLPFLLITVVILKMNINYVWISYFIGDFFEFLISITFYKKKKWLKKRV